MIYIPHKGLRKHKECLSPVAAGGRRGNTRTRWIVATYLESAREVPEADAEAGRSNRPKESVGCPIADYLDWVRRRMSVFGDGTVPVGR